MTAIPGCDQHADLVERALGPDATDTDLERYATEVATCPACQRLLAVGAGVHPAHLEHAAAGEHAAIEARLVMDDAAVERLEKALRPAPRWPLAVGALAAAAVLFALAWPLAPRDAATVEPIRSTPIDAVATGPERGPTRIERRPLGEVPDDDAVAMVDDEPSTEDWPAPPFVELRESIPKQALVRDARLELVGAPVVGDSVRLAIQSASPEVVTVCVSGAENGVVWRGGVPSGRTVLTVETRAVRYAFGAPGTYRFALALGDGCGAAVHHLEVSL